MHASEQERPDVQLARSDWRDRQPGLDPAKLVFLDETWCSTNMARRYGRAPRGERCIGAVPNGHWKSTTFIGALRHNGITAPMVIDGAMNGRAFLAYVQQVLCPTLKSGDIVIADNLGSHKVAGVSQAIAATGASIVYLPPYSPDLNPIEMLFAKFKALLRKSAIRCVDALWDHIGVLLDEFSPQECANYFTAAGYVCK